MEHDDKEQSTHGTEESPPPFQPDPALMRNFERSGKPSEAEVRKVAEKTKR
jgi:hypothetical protein